MQTAGKANGGATVVVEAVTVPVPVEIKGSFVGENTLQVTSGYVEAADEYVLFVKQGDEWEECARSPYPLIILENADNSTTYGYAASMKKILSEITEVTAVKSTRDNVLIGQSITSDRNVISSFPLSNALDGDMNTRYAVSDIAGPYSVTIALDKPYALDKLRIHEFRDGAGTRSGKTKIEVFYNNAWTTVVENQALKDPAYNGDYTEFAMGNKPATELRITFENTSGKSTAATIWEIQCSGTVVILDMDMSNLYYALLLASTIDTSKMSSTELTAWNNAVASAKACLNNSSATQNSVDSCAEKLTALGLSHGGEMPVAPVASNVEISGAPEKYNSLTLNYKFTDANGDKDVCTKITWQISDDGEAWQNIEGANESNLKILREYSGKYIRARVKPGADAEPVYGAWVTSEKVGPVSDLTASLDIKADITDDNGAALTSPIAKNTPVNINVSCENIGNNPVFNISLIVAMYDADNRLVSVSSKPEYNLTAGESFGITDLKWTAPDTDGATIKIFAWNSLTGLHPYRNCIVFPGN